MTRKFFYYSVCICVKTLVCFVDKKKDKVNVNDNEKKAIYMCVYFHNRQRRKKEKSVYTMSTRSVEYVALLV